MTDDDRSDIIFELHLAEGEADRNATLVRLVRAYPDLREDLVDHWCEIVLMEWRAATNPEMPCPPVDEAEATRSLARFRDLEARLAVSITLGGYARWLVSRLVSRKRRIPET